MITLERIAQFVAEMIVYGFIDGFCLLMAGFIYVGYKDYKESKEDKPDAEVD